MGVIQVQPVFISVANLLQPQVKKSAVQATQCYQHQLVIWARKKNKHHRQEVDRKLLLSCLNAAVSTTCRQQCAFTCNCASIIKYSYHFFSRHNNVPWFCQKAQVSLDVQLPVPLVLPVRTKKRYFIPPAVGIKRKGEENTEAKARAAGIVFRQQYFERPINISCTGNS